MKKLFSILLVLSLVLSMAPAVFAAEAVEEQPVLEVTGKEELAAELAAIEAAAAQEEAREELDPETDIRRMEADLRAKQVADREEGEFELLASQNKVAVKVDFPQAADEGGSMIIYLHQAAVLDDDGFVLEEPYAWSSKSVQVAAGARSVSTEFSVPSGSYFVEVYPQTAITGSYVYKEMYFNGDGTLATNEYTAEPISITGDKTLKVTLPEAERTISGKLKFSSSLEKDIRFYVRAMNESDEYYVQARYYFDGKKGDTSVPFSISVPADSYSLQFYNQTDGNWGYYDVTGGLSTTSNIRVYASTFGQSVSDLVVNGDALITENEEVVDDETYRVDINVKLPEKTTEGKNYMFLIYDHDNDELWDYYNYRVNADVTEISDYYWLPANRAFSFGYMEINDWMNLSWEGPHAGARWQTESGITTQIDKAKVYTLSDENITVTIDDSSCYKLTGTLELSAARKSFFAAYAVAEFENGERYAGRTVFHAGETSMDYTIYVPKSESGTFDHWAAETAAESDFLLDEATRVDNQSYTLSGNKALPTITLVTPEPNVIGKVSLPDGMTAPEGGLAVQININGSYLGTYLMAEGKSSMDFDFIANLSSEDWENYVNLWVMNPPKKLIANTSFSVETAAEMEDLDITLQEAVILSGDVIVADAAKALGTTFRVYCNYDNYYGQLNLSVLPGETTAAYEVKVPKGEEGQVRIYVQADATGKVMSADQYLQPNGTFDTQYKQVALIENTVADATFAEGKTISGTVSLASGLPSGYYYGQVYARPESGGSDYRGSFSFTGTSGTYKVAVPADYIGSWRVYCTINSNSDTAAMTGTPLYYSVNGIVNSSNSASLIQAPADGIDFVVPKARVISGSVIMPEAFNGYYYWGNVYVINSEGERQSVYVDEEDPNYTIKVPVDDTGTYKLAVRLNAEEDIPGLITGTYLYLTEDGTLSAVESDAAEFAVGADGLQKDLLIPVGSSYTVKLKAPQGFSGYYDGYLYLYDLDTQDYPVQKSVEFEGTETTVSLSLPSGEGRYALRIYLYEGPGVVTNSYYYYNTTTSTWVNNTDEATALDFTEDGIEVTLPKAKTISGKLVTADGSAIETLEDGFGFSIYQKGDSYDSSVRSNRTIDANGNFTLTVPSDLTGKLRIYCWPYDSETNVLDKNYHYKSDATGAVNSHVSGDDTFYFEVGEEDVTGLKIYVDTGWVLSGTVKLGTGGAISGSNDHMGSVGIRLESETDYYYTSASMRKDETPWTYSIVLPKTAATYKMSYEVNANDNSTSNLYDEQVETGTVNVTGSATLPDIVLKPGKHTITVTVKNPASGYVNGNLYLELVDEDPSADVRTNEKPFNNSANGSATYKIITSPEETAVSYKLYYHAYSAQGIVSGKYVYVAADGTLTTDATAAGIFSLTENTVHTITLMEKAPYVSGKIYLPDDLDDEDFRIELSGNSYQTIDVRPDTILKDSKGQYVPYALYSNYLDAGDTFYLQYYLNTSYYSGDVLFAGETVYLGEDGSNCHDYYDKAYFTIPESGAAVLDFALATWNDGAEDNLLQSAHGINSETGELTYTYSYPGATYLLVTFSERTDTSLVINGQHYYSYNLDGEEKNIDVTATGGTMTIVVNSTNTYDRDYGFAITKIVPLYEAEAVIRPTVTSLYSANGSEEATVLEDITAGEQVYVSMAAPAESTGIVLVAVYDDQGKMLEVCVNEMDFAEGYASTALNFTDAEDAASLKIMFVDDNWALQNLQRP